MELDHSPSATLGKRLEARLWLARYAFRRGDLERAERLAEELCTMGVSVAALRGVSFSIDDTQRSVRLAYANATKRISSRL